MPEVLAFVVACLLGAGVVVVALGAAILFALFLSAPNYREKER